MSSACCNCGSPLNSYTDKNYIITWCPECGEVFNSISISGLSKEQISRKVLEFNSYIMCCGIVA